MNDLELKMPHSRTCCAFPSCGADAPKAKPVVWERLVDQHPVGMNLDGILQSVHAG